MKRLALLISPLFVVVIAIAAVVVAQQPGQFAPPVAVPRPAGDRPQAPPHAQQYPTPQAPRLGGDYQFLQPSPLTQSDALKQKWQLKFTVVAKEIVELLDEEELEAEFQTLARRASELKARRILRGAIEELKGIIKNHPETEAAIAADQLLNARGASNDDASSEGQADSSDEPVSDSTPEPVASGEVAD